MRVCGAWAVALALGALLGAAPSREAFGVGVLRRDGIIVPFAAFDGKRWLANWPLPAAEVMVPISVRDVPRSWWGPTRPLDTWQAWIGGAAQSLRVVQPDWVEVHCTRQIGLRTDYGPATAAPAPTEQPYPKDGLAVSPAQPVERVDVVQPESGEMRALLPAIHEAFNKAERETESLAGGHPVAQRSREGRLPDVEAVYAAGDSPRIYYVEATRRYRRLGQRPDQCAGLGFGTGWFLRDAAGVRSLLTVVDVLHCDRRGASYMLPLGAMRLRARTYWLAQFSGWNHERYVVVEIKKKTVEAVLNKWGGSC